MARIAISIVQLKLPRPTAGSMRSAGPGSGPGLLSQACPEVLVYCLTGRHRTLCLASSPRCAFSPNSPRSAGLLWGGLAALYARFRYPEFFGGALAMSPLLDTAGEAVFEPIANLSVPEFSRIYLDAGAREDRGRLLPLVVKLATHLVVRGWDSDRLLWRPDPRGTHSETSWRRRLPKALGFLYSR